LSQFDGKVKTMDWTKLPTYPAPPATTPPGSSPWVDPSKYFDELPVVMKRVPPMPGEESLYKLIGSVLDAATKDPEIM